MTTLTAVVRLLLLVSIFASLMGIVASVYEFKKGE